MRKQTEPYQWADIKTLLMPQEGDVPPKQDRVTPKAAVTRGTAKLPDGIAEGSRNATLFKLGAVLRRGGKSHEDILAALLAHNRDYCDPPLVESEVHTVTENVARYVPDIGFSLTDTGNAERLVLMFGDSLRYVHKWKKWLFWDGTRWLIDERQKVMSLAKRVAVGIAVEAVGQSDTEGAKAIQAWCRASQDRPRLKAMLELAQPELSVLPGELDRDPMLLNIQNGTLDLRTGALRTHNKADLITKMALVEYKPEAKAPQWLKFLDKILEGNTDLQAFMQAAAGYGLTGLTGEHCLFILYGRGRNGKSTFLSTLEHILNDYHEKAEMRSLINRENEGVRNDIAKLKGARWVSAVEIGRGRRLNEALIKELTGGDTITARFLYAEYFTFVPQFKLFLAVNDRPEIRGVDEGIWSRIRLIPFSVTIPEAERDKELGAKLKAEASGILNWLLEGCLRWQREGLPDVKAIKEAVASYRASMDIIAEFLNQACVFGEKLKVSVTDLHTAYEIWCRDVGYQAENKNNFGKMMGERGYKSDTLYIAGRSVRGYTGIGIKALDAIQDSVF